MILLLLRYTDWHHWRLCSQECLTTGFRFSVTHDDPLFGQSEPHDVCDKSPGDESLVQQPLFQHQQLQDGNGSEKPVTCDYLSPYAFTARNSLGSTSGTDATCAHVSVDVYIEHNIIEKRLIIILSLEVL